MQEAIRFISLKDLVALVSQRYEGSFMRSAQEIFKVLQGGTAGIYQLHIDGYRLCVAIDEGGKLQPARDANTKMAGELTALIYSNRFVSNPDGGLVETCNAYGFNVDEIKRDLNLVISGDIEPEASFGMIVPDRGWVEDKAEDSGRGADAWKAIILTKHDEKIKEKAYKKQSRAGKAKILLKFSDQQDLKNAWENPLSLDSITSFLKAEGIR